MEKVIVTGGAGFIGSHIVDALIFDGYEVHIIDNLSAGKQKNVHASAVLHVVDIRDREKLTPIFKNAKYVFHEAALPQVQFSIENPAETHDVNVNGLLNILELSQQNGVKRLIFAASSAAYGNQEKLPLVETMEANPLSPYAVHKYIGEVYCKLWADLYGLETVSLRYFNVYGPRQNHEGAYSSVIAKFINMSKLGLPLSITGDGNQTRDFIHIKDVVSANLAAMKSTHAGKGEVINIGGTTKVSVNEIAQRIGGSITYIDARVESRDTQADISKAEKLLAWKPTIDLKEGIDELKKEANI